MPGPSTRLTRGLHRHRRRSPARSLPPSPNLLPLPTLWLLERPRAWRVRVCFCASACHGDVHAPSGQTDHSTSISWGPTNTATRPSLLQWTDIHRHPTRFLRERLSHRRTSLPSDRVRCASACHGHSHAPSGQTTRPPSPGGRHTPPYLQTASVSAPALVTVTYTHLLDRPLDLHLLVGRT